MLPQISVPVELKEFVEGLETRKASVCLARLDHGSCHGSLLSHQAKVLYLFKGEYVLYIASGNIVDGRFEMGIARQYPISNEQAASLMKEESSHKERC